MMKQKVDQKAKAAAVARLVQMQKSPKFRSFYTTTAIDAFASIESSFFAGKVTKKRELTADPSNWYPR